MMATLLELVNEVLRRTGQVEVSTLNGAGTPATQAVDFLNEAYVEMLQRLRVERLAKSGSITTVADTALYSLVADASVDTLISDSVLETGSGDTLAETDYTHPQRQGVDATGRPEVFYRNGGKLALYPTPDAAYTMTYRYMAVPSPLENDADTTLLPAEWETVLVLGTQARLEKFLGESAGESYLLYRDGLDRLQARSPLKPRHRMHGPYRGYQGQP